MKKKPRVAISPKIAKTLRELLAVSVLRSTESVPTDRVVRAHKAALALLPRVAGRCRVCGCTETSPGPAGDCPGGCWWVDDDETLCSWCAGELLS